jgi:hypothetical protein
LAVVGDLAGIVCRLGSTKGLVSSASFSHFPSPSSYSPSQIPSASQSTLRSGGVIFKLGQNTSNKLLNGIFVSLLLPDVARINSTTVLSKSLFSRGSRKIRERIERMRTGEGGGIDLKEGMASVDRDGGFRSANPDLGPSRMPPPPPPICDSALTVVSLFTAASNSDDNL